MLGPILAQYGVIGIPVGIFWVWMIIDCARNEPQSSTWLWLVIWLGPLGALIYFFSRKLPALSASRASPHNLRGEIRYLEEQVRQVGNVYYLAKLGEAYLELGRFEKAFERFELALEQEPQNVSALMGQGRCLLAFRDPKAAAPVLEKAYAIEPGYRMGRLAEVMVDCCLELGDDKRLRELADTMPRKNRTSQMDYVHAHLLAGDGKTEEARKILERLIEDIHHLPRQGYRADKQWLKRARSLLRSL